MAQTKKTAGGKATNAVSASKGSKKSFYLVLAVAAIAGIALLSFLAAQSSKSRIITLDPSLPAISSEGWVMGSPTAPVELVEFGDFECPGCGQYAELAEPEIRQRYVATGKIRFRFIDTPLNIHRNTLNAHHAAACAGDQGKFWEMHDLLYSTQDSWNGIATTNPDKFIKTLVPQIPGLDAAKWEQCQTNRSMQAKVQAHLKISNDRGVSSTPTFEIGNKQFGLMRGDQAGQMSKIIDDALAAAATTKKP